jgi:flagellin
MPLVINSNIASLNAQRSLSRNNSELGKSMERLASGYRINRSGDDAAGLALSEKLRAQIRSSQKALDNVQDGINVLNIADGAMQGIADSLQRMRELAVQAANDTYSTSQRSAMKAELDQLASGINQISDATQFNGVFLLNGSAPASSMRLQIGANSTSGVDTLDVGGQSVFNDIDATALAVNALFVDTGTNALTSITALDTAITTLNTRRGNIGALSNRLETTVNNLSSIIENTAASESRIRNVDVASESSRMVRYQILQEASAAMLSQANLMPQLALRLLNSA